MLPVCQPRLRTVQVWAGVLPNGPDGRVLTGTYKEADTVSCGRCIYPCCIPDFVTNMHHPCKRLKSYGCKHLGCHPIAIVVKSHQYAFWCIDNQPGPKGKVSLAANLMC